MVDAGDCSPELEGYLASRDIAQALVAPVRSETRLAGVMVLGDRIGAEPDFVDEDLRLIEALAMHAGFSLELDRLEREAQSDALTGLANRALFLRRVEASLARPSGMATVLFLDLDDFKAINDRAGHAAGDAVLVAAAGRIEAAVRPADVAARLGGDEFAVLLEDVDDHHGEQVAGRVLDLFAEPVTVEGETTWVRSSVGIATAAAGSLAADELLRQADIAMYRAKEAGKSQVRVWFPEMQPAAESGETGREELAAALELGEVIAHFQPIVSLDGGAVVAVEALARWRHPRRGLVGAASFVRDADADLVAAVDREVLAQACAVAARGEVPAVHVNVAALDAATVRDVLASSGLEPDRLVLELSERALAEAPESGVAALRAMGVRIAFDDFGSGRRALEVLRERPVDIVKIARPFVDGAGRLGHDRAVLSMVVGVASMFGVQVVAQGIEREDQREALAAIGCELGQGYLLGRPLPQAAVTASRFLNSSLPWGAVMRAAEAAVSCLAVGPDDDVLVLCNDEQLTIADAIASAAEGRARNVRVLAFARRSRHGEEPPPEVVEAMTGATAIFAPTTFSLSHTAARQQASDRGVRIATMPGITEEVFRRALSVDYRELKRAGLLLAAQLSSASSCRITSPGGTDVELDLSGREGISDDGDIGTVGAFGNLPAGEAFISPSGDLRRRDDRLRRRARRLRAARRAVPGDALRRHARRRERPRGGVAVLDARGRRRARALDRRARHRHQPGGAADRQHPRGREGARHDPPGVRHERRHRRRQPLDGAHRRARAPAQRLARRPAADGGRDARLLIRAPACAS